MKKKLSPYGKILTIAVGAAASSASISYDIPRIAQAVDLINLMSYDLHGSWDSTTGINAPLYAGPADITSKQKELNIDAIVNFWISQGAPKEKLVLGIPLYGRSFTLANSNENRVGAQACGAGNAGSFVSEAGFLAYSEICYKIKNNKMRRFWENTQKVPYAVSGNQWVGYDDEESVSHKLNYIKKRNLGGAMFWSIETEDFANVGGKGCNRLITMAYNSLA